MKRNIIILSALALLILLFGAVNVAAQNSYTTFFCSQVELLPISNALVEVHCFDEVQPVPTETATLVPPTSTATLLPPNSTPTPTQPSGRIEPYASAPLCTTHNSQEYHSLWNSTLGCHYDHTHGDNPHDVDDVFGTELFSYMQGEISYPWHTTGENELIKHKSYVWLVEKDLPCYSQYTEGCITDYRAFIHNDLHNVFSTHHSALIEARVCREGDLNSCGYFLVSGHQATGDLLIDNQIVLNRPEPSGAPRPVMLHSDVTGNRDFAAWYPVFQSWMRASTQISDMFGYYPVPDATLPITDTSLLHFTRLNGNQSSVQPHIIALGFLTRNIPLLDPDGDGYANYNGFVDVHTANPGGVCVAISETCSPLILNHVPVVTVGFQRDHGPFKEFDIFFGGQSSGWIVFPGFVQ